MGQYSTSPLITNNTIDESNPLARIIVEKLESLSTIRHLDPNSIT